MTFFGPDIRNGLPIGLGSVAGFGRRAFTPSVLFAAGEQGFWYDPSDLSSMYQDSAGTTPVTAVEQAVGLILDKSKGLVLGPELVTNGGPSFVNTTGWSTTGSATVSIVGGNLRITRGATAGAQTATIQYTGAVIGGGYFMTVAMAANSANINTTVQSYGNTTLANSATVGGSPTRTIFYNADRTNPFLIFRLETGSSGDYVDISLASVKAIAGNHAIQPGATNRPILRSRYNLLTYSEQFDNAAWTKTNLNTTGTPAYVNVAVAPDGTTTADKLIANTTSGLHFYRQNIATLAGSYTMSVYAKAAEYTGLWLSMDGGSNYGLFTLTGAGTATATIGTATITAVGDGWYLCTHTATRVAGTAALFFAAANPPGTINFVGDNSSGILLWGADFRAANDIASGIPSYQRIAAATDYDTVGFPVYLAFDGSDDSLYTGGNVDFSATDKMTVWAGVTKLSDATWGAVAEVSAVPGSNNGTFGMFAPYDNTNQNYGASSRGTTNVFISGAASGAGSVPAPSTDVATLQADIAAPSVALRLNGAAYVSSASSQGTGNYGSYPLYIGRRNNASNPFNGRLYQLIGRGAATSAALITQADRWVAGKQGRAL